MISYQTRGPFSPARAHGHAIHESHPMPGHSDTASLTERWDGLITQPRHILRCTSLSVNTVRCWGWLPICGMHGCADQRVRAGVAQFAVTPSKVPRRWMLPSRDTTRVILNFKLKVSISYFGVLVPRDQQVKKGIIILAEAIKSQAAVPDEG